MRNPGDATVSAASSNRTASAGDSHVLSMRSPSGRANRDAIRRHTTSMPYRSWYRLPNASSAALLTP